MIKIVILSTNLSPSVLESRKNRLDLDEEFKRIKEAFDKSNYKDEFNLDLPYVKASYEDLENIIKKDSDQRLIIHFCGHGSGDEGLVFVSQDGQEEVIDNQKLEWIFKTSARYDKNIEAVILNACYSMEQANIIKKYVPYVIGMRDAVKDEDAIAFSEGFYECLFANPYNTIEKAFEFGCHEIEKIADITINLSRVKAAPAPNDPISFLSFSPSDTQIPQLIITENLLSFSRLNLDNDTQSNLSQGKELIRDGYKENAEAIILSYQKVCSEVILSGGILNPLKDISESNLEEIISQLAEQEPIDIGENLQNVAILQFFVAYLMILLQKQQKLKYYREKLEGWLKKEDEEKGKQLITVVQDRLNREKIDKTEEINISSRKQGLLLIVIDDEQRFKLEAWLITDIGEYQSLQPQDREVSNLCYKLTPNEMIDLGKPLNVSLLKDFIKQNKSNTIRQIKIFLPHKIIATMNAKQKDYVDAWEIDPPLIPGLSSNYLGKDYEIVLGISERLSEEECENPQYQKWLDKNQKIKSIQNLTIDKCLISEDDLQQKIDMFGTDLPDPYIFCKKLDEFNINILGKYHSLDMVIGSRLTHLLSCKDKLETILQIIYYTGIPLFFWIRPEAEEELQSGEQFNQICQCHLKDLPQKIQAQRFLAYGESFHLGHHLSLILDDSSLLPPSSNKLKMA